MSYTITITESRKEDKKQRGDYTVTGFEFLSVVDYETLPFADKKNWKEEDGQYSRPVYGYPPETVVTEEVSVKVFEQTVDFLNIKNVIQAVNQEPAHVAVKRLGNVDGSPK